jgi:hypothetical protein
MPSSIDRFSPSSPRADSAHLRPSGGVIEHCAQHTRPSLTRVRGHDLRLPVSAELSNKLVSAASETQTGGGYGVWTCIGWNSSQSGFPRFEAINAGRVCILWKCGGWLRIYTGQERPGSLSSASSNNLLEGRCCVCLLGPRRPLIHIVTLPIMHSY